MKANAELRLLSSLVQIDSVVGVTASFGVFFHEIKCNGMSSFMEFLCLACLHCWKEGAIAWVMMMMQLGLMEGCDCDAGTCCLGLPPCLEGINVPRMLNEEPNVIAGSDIAHLMRRA